MEEQTITLAETVVTTSRTRIGDVTCTYKVRRPSGLPTEHTLMIYRMTKGPWRQLGIDYVDGIVRPKYGYDGENASAVAHITGKENIQAFIEELKTLTGT